MKFLRQGADLQTFSPKSNNLATFVAFLPLTRRTIGRQDTADMHIHTRFRTAAVLGTALLLGACGKPETISGE